MANWVVKQRVQTDVDKRGLKNSRRGLKGAHPKHTYRNKEVPIGQLCRASSLGNQHAGGLSAVPLH